MTPLCGPPFLAKRAVGLAGRRAGALGRARVGPELLLLGVLDDIGEPWPRCMSNRWWRHLLAYVGLPAGYPGAASRCWRPSGWTWTSCGTRWWRTREGSRGEPAGAAWVGLRVVDLRDVGQLRARFNTDQGRPRLLLALMPT